LYICWHVIYIVFLEVILRTEYQNKLTFQYSRSTNLFHTDFKLMVSMFRFCTAVSVTHEEIICSDMPTYCILLDILNTWKTFFLSMPVFCMLLDFESLGNHLFWYADVLYVARFFFFKFTKNLSNIGHWRLRHNRNLPCGWLVTYLAM